MPNEIRILDPTCGSYVDTFRLLFLDKCQRTIFPEIFEIFGHDAAMKFIDIFGGTRIDVPSRNIIEMLARRVDVYYTLKDVPDDIHGSVVEYLAQKHSVDNSCIHHDVQEVDLVLEKYRVR